MRNDKSRSIFEGMLDRIAPIVIEKRLAAGDTMEQVEDLLDLYTWVCPAEAIEYIIRQKS